MRIAATFTLAACVLLLELQPVLADSLPLYESKPWQRMKGMPTCRSELGSAYCNGKIYVVGGVGLQGSKNAFEAYDIATNTWEVLPDLPTKLNHTGVAAWGDRIYVSGGYLNLKQTEFSEFLYAYDTRAGKWLNMGKMPGTRYKHFMIARDGWLHIVGGLRKTETWSYHVASGKWSTSFIPPLPDRRDHIGVCQDATSIYILAGRKNRHAEADCFRYDFAAGRWSVFTQVPQPRGAPTAMIHEGKIHLIGGEDLYTRETYNRHDIYDTRTGRWSSGRPMPKKRHGMTSVFHDGKWYVIGGGRRAALGTVFTAKRKLEVLSFE